MISWRNYPFEDAVAVVFDFGGVSRDLLASKNSVTDLRQIWDRFRIRLVSCDIEEMMRRHAPEPSEVETLACQWERDASHVPESTREPIRENARFFLATREVIRTEGAHAAAINCHAMPNHGLRLPCTAMVQLHREGVLLACEMDVNGMLSSMLLTHLAARPAFMGNVIPGAEETNIDISHCVAPPDMLPRLAGYSFDDHHGKTENATVAIELPKQGDATVARISSDLARVHFAVGQIVGAHHKGICRNSVAVRLPDCRSFLDNKLDGHYALVCGDVGAALSRYKTFETVTGTSG
jgi:L-fucose isomerase-like protein